MEKKEAKTKTKKHKKGEEIARCEATLSYGKYFLIKVTSEVRSSFNFFQTMKVEDTPIVR